MNILTRPDPPILVPPPDIAPDRNSLFVDFDGTLVPLVDRPDQVSADDELIDLLGALRSRFGGRLALVSGRSVEQLDAMIGPAIADITLAGSHGAETRYEGRLQHPPRAEGLDAAIVDVREFVARHPQLIAEIKAQGVAIHYRMASALEAVVKQAAADIVARHGLELQPGKKMIELRGPGGHKGDAIVALMEKPAFFGSAPVMIGDDLTDEPALAVAAELGGFGVIVGGDRETAALYALADVADVRRWLWAMTE
jgi:trehalose 6-phosphate phosphatase